MIVCVSFWMNWHLGIYESLSLLSTISFPDHELNIYESLKIDAIKTKQVVNDPWR